MATELVIARGRVLGTLTKLKTYCGTINNATPATAIEIRLSKLEDLWNEFNAIEDKLMTFIVDEVPVHESKCDYFTDRYFDVKSILLQSLREKQLNPRHTHDDTKPMDNLLDQQRLFFEGLLDRTNELNKSINHSQQDSPRLPRISIDPFSGDYSTWPSFHDLYNSTVHSNTSLSNIHKFQILKGLLKDDAASLIRHFLVTDANYTEAWEKLVKRYDKKRPILKTHIVKFFDQASASNGSVASLRRISDVSDEIIRGIKALGTEAENRDPWLIYILLNKVDEETRELWASKTLDKEFPTIYEFLEFLNDRCDAKESSNIDTKRKSTKSIEHVKSLLISTDAETEKCPCCKRSHLLHRCLNFKGMSVIKRRRMVNIYMVCYNCLKVGHTVDKCSVEKSCKICKHRHHSMLHLETPSYQNISVAPSTSEAHTSSTQSHTAQNIVHNDSTEEVHSLNANTSRFALLPTALVYIRDNAGKMHKARALLDSGSQSTFISEGLVQRLNLKRSFSTVKVTGIAETNATVTRGLVNIFIQSIHDKEEHLNVKALILSKVTSTIPPAKVELKFIEHFKDLQLADPNFYNPARIDLLIGADIFFKTLKPNQITINDSIIAQSTKFGWIVTGSTHNTEQIQAFTTITSEDGIYKLLENFWTLENVPNMPTLSESENECENHFIANTIRNHDGRYVVKLPFNSDTRPLGSSRSAAITRLIAMERRFQSKPSLQKQYHNFMNEYLQLGHMQEVNLEQFTGEDQQCYYLPHHAVFKNESTTTKLRVVFDGSCKSTTGVSLNEKLLVGPTIQRDLVSIILKFRTHAIAFSADVEKMYRQVEVNEKDTKYQKIVWRNNPTQPIKEYELRTVTYGTSCAPFLAVRVLHQIAADYKHIFPEGASMATTDFYIDDLLSGKNNIEEAKSVYDEITQMLMKGGFILRKWKSNSPEFMKKIPREYIETSNLDLHDDQERVKTLGLYWNPTKDTFSYNIHTDTKYATSKREMLSLIAQIFDPLGWISPATITFKISLQKLWLRKLSWDDPLPDDINVEWRKLQASISTLQAVEIPRFLMTYNSVKQVEVHGFSDASEQAYSAVIYLRTIESCGNINVRLVIAKTKVSPIKQISLPRLELCGAVLLSKLMHFTLKALDLPSHHITAWTDSKIVLAWLSDVPKRWKCFIGNRTSEILQIIPRSNWNHVQSKDNPADLASRGIPPNNLLESDIWWQGPQWLKKLKEFWPSEIEIKPTQLEAKKVCIIANVGTQEIKNDIIEKLLNNISSYLKIKKILIVILRWIQRYRNYSYVELFRKAEEVCIRYVQDQSFGEEIKSLKLNKKIGTKSNLNSLTPFLDNNQILRVGGRLANMDAPFYVKHPIILPKIHILSDLIIAETHTKHLHPGPTLLTSLIRQKYWIINSRYSVRKYIKTCITCCKQRAATTQQLMGNLPTARITPSRPFLHTGVDYAGPIYIKSRNGKGNIPTSKGYICIFICFSTKAIHIEFASDMTSDAFIAALKRFIARRGVPIDITSDNGTNFVGAKRELNELYQLYKSEIHINSISNYLSQNEINFYFNPASSPHFGGLWEAGIKSIKYHLKRVTQNHMMTFEEMATLLCQIEGLLNSRPLCPMSEDIEDLSSLTPGHFLIGEALTSVPEPSLNDLQENRLSRWQNIQARVQGFWRRWQIEYLHNLQQRSKWLHPTHHLNVNDFVLIKDENIPTSKWIMGRITHLHPGKDGLNRVVTIKTANGELKRPAIKISKLPLENH